MRKVTVRDVQFLAIVACFFAVAVIIALALPEVPGMFLLAMAYLVALVALCRQYYRKGRTNG